MSTPDNASVNPLRARLQELVKETDFDFVIELIDIYLNETPLQIQSMKKALESQDHHLLTIAAHTLKGSSLNLGAQELGAVCFKLEDLGRSGSPISPNTSIREIESAFEQVKEILTTFKQSKQ
jgi:HPt (histidine-containing phosphotransfer) domain-containing protein